MKTTNREYLEQKYSKLYNELGCFFAFSKQQFDEGYEKAQVDKPVKYLHVAHGLYCPKPNIRQLIDGLRKIREQWRKDRKAAEKIQLQFVGIDSWNRPIWKDPTQNKYFGSVTTLFNMDATEEEVTEKVTTFDLCYFGDKFDCEPMGTDIDDKYYIV